MRIDAAHVSTDVFCLAAHRNAHAARSGGSCVLSGSFARCGVLHRGLVRVRCACGLPLIAVTHRGGVGRWTPDRLVVHVGGSTASRARSNAGVHGRARRRTIGPARPPPCQPRAHGSSGTPRRGAPGQPGGREHDVIVRSGRVVADETQRRHQAALAVAAPRASADPAAIVGGDLVERVIAPLRGDFYECFTKMSAARS
jgi:hypothetical protein